MKNSRAQWQREKLRMAKKAKESRQLGEIVLSLHNKIQKENNEQQPDQRTNQSEP